MSPISLEEAVTRLYENESLTDELDDQPAALLLQWAESQVSQLVTQYRDDDAFEEAFKALRLLVRSMTRYVARRADTPSDEQAAYVQKRIIERAQSMGFTTQAAELHSTGAWVQAQSTADPLDAVQAVIKLVEGGGSGSDDHAPKAF